MLETTFNADANPSVKFSAELARSEGLDGLASVTTFARIARNAASTATEENISSFLMLVEKQIDARKFSETDKNTVINAIQTASGLNAPVSHP
jgi:hypothetical protein